MPNFKTYHNNKNIYSVDMMLSYINLYGHPIVKVPIEKFIPQLNENVWGEWSPMDVIKKIDSKKYKKDAELIQRANLEYPIIVSGKHIVDGYHRLAKAYLEDKKYINVYIFEAELMNKFILNKDMDFVKVHQHTAIYQIIELWTKRFCKGNVSV
jgi:hypothetical protein